MCIWYAIYRSSGWLHISRFDCFWAAISNRLFLCQGYQQVSQISPQAPLPQPVPVIPPIPNNPHIMQV